MHILHAFIIVLACMHARICAGVGGAGVGGADAQDLKSAFFSLSLSSREKGTTPVSPTAASSELVNAVILLSSIMALPAAGCHTHNNNNNNNRNRNNKQ